MRNGDGQFMIELWGGPLDGTETAMPDLRETIWLPYAMFGVAAGMPRYVREGPGLPHRLTANRYVYAGMGDA